MAYALLFVLGLSAGSFLNVVSLRYKPEERFFSFKAIGGRSRCPHCGKELSFFELVPLLSFIFQKGKCRSCGAKLSWQYPLVELIAGAIFVLIPLRLASLYPFALPEIFYLLSAFWITLFLTLLLLSIVDFRHYIIPDGLNIFIAVLGVVFILFKIIGNYDFAFHGSLLSGYALFLSFTQNIFLNHITGAAAGAVLFGTIIFVTRGRGMGFGDLKLASALGVFLGWPDIFFASIFAFLIGGIVSAPLLFSGPSALLGTSKKTMKSVLPFGPFIVLGAATVFFFGHEILKAYFLTMGV